MNFTFLITVIYKLPEIFNQQFQESPWLESKVDAGFISLYIMLYEAITIPLFTLNIERIMFQT